MLYKILCIMVKISKPINITAETKNDLSVVARSRKSSHSHVTRAKVLLNLAENIHPREISISLKIGESTVRALKSKAKSLMALDKFPIDHYLNDRPRSGRPPTILLENQQTILKAACQTPSEYNDEIGGGKWTFRRLKTNLEKSDLPFKIPSISYMSKLLKKRQIKPHKHRNYLISTDPDFGSKMAVIATIYKDLREDKLTDKVVVSVDEKTQIQALKNIREEVMPYRGFKRNNRYRLRDPEYKRLGVTNLFCGTNLKTGELYAKILDKNRSVDFCEFLEHLHTQIDPTKIIVILADNLMTHKSKETLKFLEKFGSRFEFVFTPTHSSWMNPIEGVFSSLQRGYLRDLRVNSLDDLKRHISLALKEMSERPRPANWEKFIKKYFEVEG